MGWFDWIGRLLTGRRPAETVPFLDVKSGRVVRIPAAELRPGAVQVRLAGHAELVWVLAEELKGGGLRHPPFGEEIRKYIRQIQAAFAEHRPLTLEEWEDGFRQDANAEREIALWSHAADVYGAFASPASSPGRRGDIYRVIVACLVASPDSVWRVLEPLAVLTRAEADEIIARFYGRKS